VVGIIGLVLIQGARVIGTRVVCEISGQIAALTGDGEGGCGGGETPARTAKGPAGGAGGAEPTQPTGQDGSSGGNPLRGAPRGGTRGTTSRGRRGLRARGADGLRYSAGSSRNGRPSGASTRYRARAARKRLQGVIRGRRIDTSRYRRKAYCKRYRCSRPTKTQYAMPNYQRRRGGKLRVSLFIKQKEVRPLGTLPILVQGDGRGFDRRFDSLRTRVTFVFDFKADKLTVLVNPSCSRGRVVRDGCSSPKKGKVTVEARGGNGAQSYNVEYKLRDSRIPAPDLSGHIEVSMSRDARGHRNIGLILFNEAYPSVEAYYDPPGPKGPRTVCQSRESNQASDLGGPRELRCKSET